LTQVFISYSRKDLAFVERLAKDLMDAGLKVWYDLSGLEAGTRWGKEIQNALQQSQYLLVILSPNSIQSEWVEKEFLYANNLKLKTIPILYTPCVLPMWFINLHFIDMQGKNYKLHFSELLKALGIQPGEAIKTVEAVTAIPLPKEPPGDLQQIRQPIESGKKQDKVPRWKASIRPAWIIGLVGLVAVIAFAIWGIPPLAARLAPTPIPSPTVTATYTPTSTSTPTLTPTETTVPTATLDPTTGIVTGSITWASKPFEGVVVKLCTDWLYTCKGTEYTAITEAQGIFTFTGLEPGKYQLITKVPDQVDETRSNGGGDLPVTIEVSGGQAVYLDPLPICKHDLVILLPTIQGDSVTFSWKAYPGATDYYAMGFNPSSGQSFGPGHTSSTRFSVNLSTGQYEFSVNTWVSDGGCAEGMINFTMP
jgi:hypothetical protein